MNAKEARAKAYAHNTSASDSQYAKAKKQIETYASKGEYECWFYERMLDDVKLKLVQEGYVVGDNKSDRDGTQIKINW